MRRSGMSHITATHDIDHNPDPGVQEGERDTRDIETSAALPLISPADRLGQRRMRPAIGGDQNLHKNVVGQPDISSTKP